MLIPERTSMAHIVGSHLMKKTTLNSEYDAWIQVDAAALTANVQALKALLATHSPPPRIIGVAIKANA